MKVYTQQTGTRRLEPTFTTFIELTEKEAAKLEREFNSLVANGREVVWLDPRRMLTTNKLGALLADDLDFHRKRRGR